jgi:hypothetical protein
MKLKKLLNEAQSAREVQEKYNALINAANDLFFLFDEHEQDSDAKIAFQLGNHIRKELKKMDWKRLMKKVNKG